MQMIREGKDLQQKKMLLLNWLHTLIFIIYIIYCLLTFPIYDEKERLIYSLFMQLRKTTGIIEIHNIEYHQCVKYETNDINQPQHQHYPFQQGPQIVVHILTDKISLSPVI